MRRRGHRKYKPLPGDAFELMVSAFGEHEARSRNQVAHGGRHQYLARPGQGRDARADNHRHPGDIVFNVANRSHSEELVKGQQSGIMLELK